MATVHEVYGTWQRDSSVFSVIGVFPSSSSGLKDFNIRLLVPFITLSCR
jgi:hypothetical protein